MKIQVTLSRVQTATVEIEVGAWRQPGGPESPIKINSSEVRFLAKEQGSKEIEWTGDDICILEVKKPCHAMP